MFEKELKPYQDRLAQHPIYSAIRSVEHVRIFMSRHVFAVWDFMSLAKRLQRDFTCVELPWMPVLNEDSARLINEIITGEESDIGHDGQPASHFRLYLDAMIEVSAPTEKIETFISQFALTYALGKALNQARVPAYVQTFVKHTIKTLQRLDCRSGQQLSFLAAKTLLPESTHRSGQWRPRTRRTKNVVSINHHAAGAGKKHCGRPLTLSSSESGYGTVSTVK